MLRRITNTIQHPRIDGTAGERDSDLIDDADTDEDTGAEPCRCRCADG